MKKIIVDFFKNKGYIFVALLCITAIVAVGIAVINTGNNDDEPVISYSTPVSKPVAPTDVSGATPTAQPTAASKPVDDSQNNNSSNDNQSQPGEIVIIKPLDGEIQSEFAATKLVYNTTLQEWRTHSGIDIGATPGSVVNAAASGVVSAIKNDPRYGLTVVLDHSLNGHSFSTVYCGLSKTAGGITDGAAIGVGAAIGLLGEDIFCERAQGAHLHFELIENNEPLDPCKYWK